MTVPTLTVVPEPRKGSGTAPAVGPTHAHPATDGPRFLLGTHLPHWLRLGLGVELFVSDRRLRRYRTLPRATDPFGLDSGGFTELSTYGSWKHGPTPTVYAARTRRYAVEVGQLAWAAPQDWMCEPPILRKTGLSVTEHQRRTVDNYLRLRDFAPDLPFIPVVQGWTPCDYLRCVDLYAWAGVDLTTAHLVGVGSICRRQGTAVVGEILTLLHRAGVDRLHGFGLKTQGLARHGQLLISADSMAWSKQATYEPPLPGCTHKNCANCLPYALTWRRHVIAATAPGIAARPLFGLTPRDWDA